MKLLLLLPLLVAPLCAEINEPVLLKAIAAVETGNRDLRGAHGEVGVFQVTPAVRARVGGSDEAAVRRWLVIMKRDMNRYGIPINVFNLSLVYNGGINAVRKGRVAMSTYQYAGRVSTTYQAMLPREVEKSVIHTRILLTPPIFTLPSHP